MKRRNFLNTILGGFSAAFAGSIIYPMLAFLKTPPTTTVEVTSVKVGKVGDLAPNTAKVFQFGERAAMIVKSASGEMRAFDATCTHLACTVQYRADKSDIWCACHNGVYDMNGRNVSGPPPRPMTTMKVSILNDEIIVSKA
jgi:cytochrome b6-f complex iron-sulfur subunit